MLMSKAEALHRRAIQQTLNYQAEVILQASAGVIEATEMLMACRDNETCSKLLALAFNLGKSKEMLERMLAEVRATQPTRQMFTAPPTRRM